MDTENYLKFNSLLCVQKWKSKKFKDTEPSLYFFHLNIITWFYKTLAKYPLNPISHTERWGFCSFVDVERRCFV